MAARLDWYGCATFRLTVGSLVIFLDAYIDRVPGAPGPGLRADDIERADWIVVGHSHFDHLWGAERIARRTGATLHSCVWTAKGGMYQPDEVCLGDLGVSYQERMARMQEMVQGLASLGPEIQEHRQASEQGVRGDGGSFVYLFETPEGSLLYQDTSGHWSGILHNLRPDVAILAAAGRGTIDGEPIQGTLAQFVAQQADLLRPRRVILDHHDDWLPGFSIQTRIAPIREAMLRSVPRTELVELGYLSGYLLFKGLR